MSRKRARDKFSIDSIKKYLKAYGFKVYSVYGATDREVYVEKVREDAKIYGFVGIADKGKDFESYYMILDRDGRPDKRINVRFNQITFETRLRQYTEAMLNE